MNAATGTFHNGQVTFTTPPDWQDGATVRVELDLDYVGVGMREEDWPTDPEGVAALLAKIDALEPFLTEEEEERWMAALEEENAHSRENFQREAEEAERLFK
jgi:hypothetical protein